MTSGIPFASGAFLAGEGLPMFGKLLGYTKVQITPRYAHLANDHVKAAATRIASRIAHVVGWCACRGSSGGAGRQLVDDGAG